jgi:hypothetical protein
MVFSKDKLLKKYDDYAECELWKDFERAIRISLCPAAPKPILDKIRILYTNLIQNVQITQDFPGTLELMGFDYETKKTKKGVMIITPKPCTAQEKEVIHLFYKLKLTFEYSGFNIQSLTDVYWNTIVRVGLLYPHLFKYQYEDKTKRAPYHVSVIMQHFENLKDICIIKNKKQAQKDALKLMDCLQQMFAMQEKLVLFGYWINEKLQLVSDKSDIKSTILRLGSIDSVPDFRYGIHESWKWALYKVRLSLPQNDAAEKVKKEHARLRDLAYTQYNDRTGKWSQIFPRLPSERSKQLKKTKEEIWKLYQNYVRYVLKKTKTNLSTLIYHDLIKKGITQQNEEPYSESRIRHLIGEIESEKSIQLETFLAKPPAILFDQSTSVYMA